MEIRDYLHVLRRGWAIVVALVVVGLAGGIALTLSTSKVYQANVQVFVATATSKNAVDLTQGQLFAQDRVQSYTSIANGPAVTNAVIRQLGLNLTPAQLAAKISADAPQNKILINLHVTDQNPRTAAKLANAVAAQFNATVAKTEQTDANGESVVKLSVIHPATVPGSPIKPNKIINLGLGLVLGLLVGVGIVIVRDRLDNTLKGPQDLEALGIPMLGLVPFDKRVGKSPIAFRGDAHGQRSEAYRQLRTNLQFVNVDKSPRIIAVTSAVPGEGKTTTSLNLAAALAEGGYRVCLIEADLRRPTIAKTLGLVSDVGFTTALIGKANAADVLQNAGRNLAVLTCGPVPPNPSELLITSQAKTIITELAANADYTIIDTAPLLPVADGAEVSAMADATIVVYHSGTTTRDQAMRAIQSLEKVGERPVGIVLNMLTRGRGITAYDQSYYYTYRPDRSRRSRDNASDGRSDDRVEVGDLIGASADDDSADQLPQSEISVPDQPSVDERDITEPLQPVGQEFVPAEQSQETAPEAGERDLDTDESPAIFAPEPTEFEDEDPQDQFVSEPQGEEQQDQFVSEPHHDERSDVRLDEDLEPEIPFDDFAPEESDARHDAEPTQAEADASSVAGYYDPAVYDDRDEPPFEFGQDLDDSSDQAADDESRAVSRGRR